MQVRAGGFAVMDWGALRSDNGAFASREFLFPVGYKATFWYRHSNVAGRPR